MVFLGVDVGGTRVKHLLVDEAFRHLGFGEFETPSGLPLGEAIALIESKVTKACENTGCRPSAVCIAVPGIVTPGTSHVVECPNLPGWEDFDLKDYLRELAGIPLWVENDANAGAFGEGFCGAAKGLDSFVYIALGTGVGGGIFLNGKLHRGVFGRAGEVGHVPISDSDVPCGCGGTGHLECFAGAIGILRQAEKEFSGEFRGDTEELSRLAAGGDERALRVFRDAGSYLGKGIAAVVNVIDVDTVVLAGGVAGALPFMKESIYEQIGKHTFGIPPERVRVIPGVNGHRAGAIGAAAIALHEYKRRLNKGGEK